MSGIMLIWVTIAFLVCRSPPDHFESLPGVLRDLGGSTS